MLVSHHQDLFRPFGPCVPRSDSDVTSHGPAADVTSLADDTAMVMINQKKTDGKTGAHLAWKEINTSVHPEQVYLYGDLGIQYRKKIQNTSFSSWTSTMVKHKKCDTSLGIMPKKNDQQLRVASTGIVHGLYEIPVTFQAKLSGKSLARIIWFCTCHLDLRGQWKLRDFLLQFISDSDTCFFKKLLSTIPNVNHTPNVEDTAGSIHCGPPSYKLVYKFH